MNLEPITRRHRRADFDCGRNSLNVWLARYARQQEKKGTARTFVLTPDGEEVAGYYSLSSYAVAVTDAPQDMAKGMKEGYVLPAVLLSRLAVDEDYQGNGLGERLLADAMRRVVAMSQSIAIAVVVVDALDDEAAGFYERYGFVRWPTDALQLFVRVKDLQQTFGIAPS